MRARGVHIDPSLVLLGGSPARDAHLATAQGAAAESSRPCQCPRCGYDVTGDIPNWTRACPLHGRCPECGLDFEWGVLFSPAGSTPRWSFEHVREGLLGAFIRTLLRTLAPPILWSGLRIEHPLRWERLRVWVVVLAVMLVLACSARNAAAYRLMVGAVGMGGLTEAEYVASIALPFWPWGRVKYHDPLTTVAPIVFVLLASVFIVLAHLTIAESMLKAKVRQRHLWRVAAYSWTGVVIILGITAWVPIANPAGWMTFNPNDPSWLYSLKLAFRAMRLIDGAGALLSIAWLGVFWFSAEKRYLRMRHASGVALAVLLMGGMAALAVVAYTPWQIVLQPLVLLDQWLFGTA